MEKETTKRKNPTTIQILGLAAIGYILFSSFKKKQPTVKTGVLVYQYQDNAPSGTTQVFSKIGTNVYDDNFNVIYTFKDSRIGMTLTGTKGAEMFSVVIGQSFMNGIPGYVFKYDVQTL
jgi:hypothetical protein